jgi:predicted nucleic acid-binding protein
MLDYENAENPYEDKRNSISPWKALADDFCGSSDDILQSGKDIMKNGIRAKDALHIACAIYKSCQYFITTDKKLINKKIDGIKLINPIDFILEVEEADEN